ncbi:MAG: hypothetical protein ACLFMY_07605, partial [Guyparkeria sp.]
MAEQSDSTWTESRFRQRLVGAAVVVALAVLLLPLWLDGSGIDSLSVQPIPEKPEVASTDPGEISQPPGDSSEPLDDPPSSLFPDQASEELRAGSHETDEEDPAPEAPVEPEAPSEDESATSGDSDNAGDQEGETDGQRTAEEADESRDESVDGTPDSDSESAGEG